MWTSYVKKIGNVLVIVFLLLFVGNIDIDDIGVLLISARNLALLPV